MALTPPTPERNSGAAWTLDSGASGRSDSARETTPQENNHAAQHARGDVGVLEYERSSLALLCQEFRQRRLGDLNRIGIERRGQFPEAVDFGEWRAPGRQSCRPTASNCRIPSPAAAPARSGRRANRSTSHRSPARGRVGRLVRFPLHLPACDRRRFVPRPFIWIELTAPKPLVHLRLLKRRNFGIGVIANVLVGFALFGTVYILPQYPGQVH
jgi:hypothetical protein